MSYQEFKSESSRRAAEVAERLGATAVGLYIEGGQGCPPRVFRVVKLPRECFARETLGGSASSRLLAYARRKGLEAGKPPESRYGAMPIAWIDNRDSCQAFAW